MYKIEFNSLYVSVMDFVLDEKTERSFDNLNEEIRYYHDLVDYYTELLFNLNNLKSKIISNSELIGEINESISSLTTTFEKYKAKSSIIRSYLHELELFSPKVLFGERLYKYEQMFLTSPLIKIDVSEINVILDYAKEYMKGRTSFYFFTNNPFELYEDLGIPVPVKYTFENVEALLSSLYSYTNGLYQKYLIQYKTVLEGMAVLENTIKEKLLAYNFKINEAKRNVITVTIATTPAVYHTAVMEVVERFRLLANEIMELGVNRFTVHTKTFEMMFNDITNFIAIYQNHPLFIEFVKNDAYDKKIIQLDEHIKLIENGAIKSDVDYIITNTSLKQIVEDIIELTQTVKRKIRYTQAFHFSGKPTELEFEFFQIELFLSSIKEYYFMLVSNTEYLSSKLNIDDFGDSSIAQYRSEYKRQLSYYTKFIRQDIDYLNDSEFNIYLKKIKTLQTKLKIIAATFFGNAIKTSTGTYIPIIEKYYANFLSELNKDIANLTANRTVVILEVTDPNKEKAYKVLKSVEEIVTKITNMLDVSKSSPFFWLTDFINTYLTTPFTAFFDLISSYYNKEDYINLTKIYDKFYKDNVVNFNLMHSMIKFSNRTKAVFQKFDELDAFYMGEFTSDKPIKDKPELLEYLIDMFNDDTYKVIRNEMFNELDAMYSFIIATKPNDRVFYINERNLKKMFFDARLMKINYYKWYHNILVWFERYNKVNAGILERSDAFKKKKAIIDKFTYKNKINVLIQTQNIVLASLTRMIVEYSSDSNFDSATVSDIFAAIDQYNAMIDKDYALFVDTVRRIEKLEQYILIENKMLLLRNQHKDMWLNLITNNSIEPLDKISYDEVEVYTGNVPFKVIMKAQREFVVDVTGQEIKSKFRWYTGNTIQEGDQISYTFYEEGEQSIRCENVYENGEVFAKNVKFKIGGPENSLTVRRGTMHYAPLTVYVDQPKITYKDPETGEVVTIAILVGGSGNVLEMLEEGAIIVSKSGLDLMEERIGLVILGFEGTEFPGYAYNYAHIYSTDFKYPDESEFLFDFNLSTPLARTATLDISTSKFTKFMSRVPQEIQSVYSIDDASIFPSAGLATKIAPGDKIVLRNKYNRYAVIQMRDVYSYTEGIGENGRFYYNVTMNYYVNVSVDKFNRADFSPTRTSMDIPKLIFKTGVRELFQSMIDRLEKIKDLKNKIGLGGDVEKMEIFRNEIIKLNKLNAEFYLFEELEKIKAKRLTHVLLLRNLEEKFSIDIDAPFEVIDDAIIHFRAHIDNVKSFREYITSIHAYSFLQSVVDLKVLIDLFKEQQTIFEIVIDTYDYINYDITYFENRLKEIKMFSTAGFINKNITYGRALIKLILHLRELLFKIKLVINYPIMSQGNHIVFFGSFKRLRQDLISGKWSEKEEFDLFLFNKKLELQFGYEIGKVENNNLYKDFITDLVVLEKNLFGRGLSNADVDGISRYTQELENRSTGEYDDFFMFQYWIDYLEKNTN